MALIKVGIHDNLRITKETSVNKEGSLELFIESAQSKDSMLSAFEENTTFTKMSSCLRFYPPSEKDFKGVIQSSADLGAALLKTRYQLMQYALLYATKEQVNEAFGGTKMLEGIGIKKEAFSNTLATLNKNPKALQAISTNLANLFVKFCKDYKVFDSKVLFRQKFLRQSDAKNFAVIPSSDFDTWIEPMTVPKEQSKIAYSQWEIDNGKNNPDPVVASAADTTPVDTSKADALFKADEEEVKAPKLD